MPANSSENKPVAAVSAKPREFGADAGRARELDDIDRRLIRELQQDGRMPYTKLSKIVGLSEPSVRQRVQRLRDSGVIAIVAVSDLLEGGNRLVTLVGLKVHGDATEVARALCDLSETTWVVASAGTFDLVIEVICSGPGELLELVNRIRAIDGVTDTDSMLCLRIYKHIFTYGTP